MQSHTLLKIFYFNNKYQSPRKFVSVNFLHCFNMICHKKTALLHINTIKNWASMFKFQSEHLECNLGRQNENENICIEEL